MAVLVERRVRPTEVLEESRRVRSGIVMKEMEALSLREKLGVGAEN